jgi:CRP-like cAMP-binding protein
MGHISSASNAQDVVSFLPQESLHEFSRRQTIYAPGQPCMRLYLVRSGRVIINNSLDGASPTVSRIVGPSGFFGESLLVGVPRPFESAVALDRTRVMSWDCAEVEQQMSRDARLAMALLNYFVGRCSELNMRIEALAFRRNPERIMLALLQLSETLGTTSNGGIRLEPLTHQMIAEYVGKSRAMVSAEMAELRRSGLLQYSRKGIEFNAASMRETLYQRGIGESSRQTLLARAAF